MTRAAMLAFGILFFALTANAAAHVTRIPHRCTKRPAVRLCAIHFHHDRSDQYREQLGLSHIRYQWRAEAHPSRVPRILTYWIRTQSHLKRRLTAYRHSTSPVALITRIFGPAASQAIAVAECESHLDPNAHNSSGASGLFQLMPIWWQGQNPYDPAVNTRIAYQLYERSGWAPWTCQP